MSSINPVSRSMNGIKTIETSEVIFTDDNSSLNTSAGIVQAQANSTTALNSKINTIDFDTNTGVLTLNKEDTSTITKDLDGRYFEGTTLSPTDIPDLPAGKITSDAFDEERIPDLNASKITEGTLATDRIPELDADKITTGTLDTAIIPNLNASKITAGTLATDRIPTDLSTYVRVGTAGTHTDETIYGVKTFNEPPECSTTPLTDHQLANKSYVLSQIPNTSNFVDRTTDQTIDGVKTFSSVPICSTTPTTNDELVNRYYALSTFVNIADNYQIITGNKTFSNGIKVQSINAIGSDGVIVRNNSGSGGFSVNNNGYTEITDRLSIGTGASPRCPLDIEGGGGTTQSGTRSYFQKGSTGISRDTGGFGNYGIFSEKSIGCGSFFLSTNGNFISSDIRIKKDVKTIDEAEALEKIRKIRPVNYKYIDERKHETTTQTGFIAQEINEVLPLSITLMEKHIPNIYECVKVSDTYTITFTKPTPLKVGDGLEFYGCYDVGRATTITEVINDTTIKIKDDLSDELCDMSGNKGGDCLFCYGELVKDFQHLKYDDVFTTLLSAVKLMDKRITELEQKLNM